MAQVMITNIHRRLKALEDRLAVLEGERLVDFELALDVVAKHFGLQRETIMSRCRSQDLVNARCIIANLMIEEEKSISYIARKFGLDRGSIRYHLRSAHFPRPLDYTNCRRIYLQRKTQLL